MNEIERADAIIETICANTEVTRERICRGEWTIVKYFGNDLVQIRDNKGEVLVRAQEYAKTDKGDEHCNLVRYLLRYAFAHAVDKRWLLGKTLFEKLATATFGGQIIVVDEKRNQKYL